MTVDRAEAALDARTGSRLARANALRDAMAPQLELRRREPAGMVAATDPVAVRLAAVVRRALPEVGAGPWPSWSLRDYDADRFGPLLGVRRAGHRQHNGLQALRRSHLLAVLFRS